MHNIIIMPRLAGIRRAPRFVYLSLLALTVCALSRCAPAGKHGPASGIPDAGTTTGTLPVEHLRKITPPVPALDVPFQTRSVQTGKAVVWDLPGGTRLTIPAHAFVFEDGTPVTGKADLHYREFRHVADIVRSGIPMEYDSAGQTLSFSSAGMMELRASQQKRALALAPGKTIQVELSSQRTGLFNLYVFNEKAGNWQNLQNNLQETPLNRENPLNNPIPGSQQAPEAYAFTIRAKAMPGLEDLDGTNWIALQTRQQEYADLNARPELLNETWSRAALDFVPGQEDRFTLSLSNNSQTIKLLVQPENTQLAANLTPRTSSVAITPASLYRLFGMQQLGVYNCDRVLNSRSKREVAVAYDINPAIHAQITSVYTLQPVENSVMYHGNPGYLIYTQVSRNGLMVAFSDGSVALVAPEAFERQLRAAKPVFSLTPVFYESGKELERQILAM